MHLVFYTRDILDLSSFGSGLSWAIVIGGVYGCIRLAKDVLSYVRRTSRGFAEVREEGRVHE